MPFVMRWSLLESMAMQATIVASDVPSVREPITHGETGLPVDFLDADALAHVVGTYDFRTLCLPEHIRQMNTLVPKKLRIAVPG